MTKIKICGLQRFKDIEYVNEGMPDYVGFVFAKSPRKVDLCKAYLLKSELNPDIKAVGVFVNEDMDFIKRCCEMRIIDMVQLHGDEDDEYIKKLKKIIYKPVIKAIRVKGEITIPQSLVMGNTKRNGHDYILFDAYDEKAYGGTGKVFEWEKIEGFKYKYFLAGGLDEKNVRKAIDALNPYCVDVSSSIESEGVKSREKILGFIKKVRNTESENTKTGKEVEYG